MAGIDDSNHALLNVSPGLQMKMKTVPKPSKVNPYIEPPQQNNFVNSPDNRERLNERIPATLATNEDANYADYSKRRATPERQSLLKGDRSADASFLENQNQFGEDLDGEVEGDPQSYAVFEDDMQKIKKFKDDYNGVYEKDKNLDREILVRQIKLQQLIDHSNELIDK